MRSAISRSLIPLLTVILGLASLMTSRPAFAWWMYTPGDTVDNVGYEPKQPIPFSHKLHAGTNKIPCQYCHSSARRSAAAGIPSLNTCFGCHRLIDTDHEWIKKVVKHYKDNDPIQWVKVDDLPDFVRFSHKIHVNAKVDGKPAISCQECHGNVQEMDVVSQVAPLQMGWCIGCHKEKGAKIDCIACHY